MIELVVVMAIIVIVLTIALPNGLAYVRNYSITAAAQNVATQMQASRTQAVRRNSRRGIILNFDYPNVGGYQYTSLDEDPINGGYDGSTYPVNPGVYDPNPPSNYGAAPVPPANVNPPAPGIPSPHGVVMNLPNGTEFIPGGGFTSLLFRLDGSVAGVNAGNVGSQVIAQNGMDWVVRIRQPQTGLTRTITISNSGRVVVTTP
jgi:type II secretory pathway pseudopilin PulG